MTEPQAGRYVLSPQDQEALDDWPRRIEQDRQQRAEAAAAATSKRRRTTLLGIGAVTALVLTGAIYGISQAATGQPTPLAQPAAPITLNNPTTSAASSPPTSSPTPTALTPTQRAEAEAEAAYREYVRVVDAVAKAGYRNTKPYDAVAVSPERPYLERQALLSRRAGERQIGDIKVQDVSVVSSNIKPSPGNYPRVVLRTCEDVRGVNVVDRAGKSTVSAGRPDFFQSTVTLHRYRPGTEGAETGGWRVYEVKTPGDSC